jgi:hypothetical protein
MSRSDITVRKLMVGGRGGSFRPCEECALYAKCKAGNVDTEEVSWPMACWVPSGVLKVWEEVSV